MILQKRHYISFKPGNRITIDQKLSFLRKINNTQYSKNPLKLR
jgi:hypothetical protein